MSDIGYYKFKGAASMSALGHVWVPWQEHLRRFCSLGRVRSRVRPANAARLALATSSALTQVTSGV